MLTGRDRFLVFLQRRLGDAAADRMMDVLWSLFRTSEDRLVELIPADRVDGASLLAAAKDVLVDDNPASGMRGFSVDSVRVVPIAEAAALRSKSAGTVRPTDWPPPGISSFGVSALLFLRYAPDMRDDVFQAVHMAVHDTLLTGLRHAHLPDGGLLGREWIVPWTTVTDSVFFYVTHTLMGLDEAAGNLGRFVRLMPGVLPIGFTLDDGGNTSGELVVIAG